VIESSSTPEYGGVAVDVTSVYWTTDTRIRKAPLRGGPIVTMAVSPARARGIVADGASIYWIANDWRGRCRVHGCGSVISMPATGGLPVTRATARSSIGYIAVDSSNLYWTTDDALMKAPIQGGAAVQLAIMGQSHTNIAVGEANVYWAQGSDIVSVPLGGGGLATLAAKEDGPGCVDVDSTDIFWRNSGHGIGEGAGTAETLMKAPLRGGASSTLVSSPWSQWSLPCDIVIDAANVYWTSTRGSLLRVPRAGGMPFTISLQEPPSVTESRGLAVSSAGGIYWAVSTRQIDEKGAPMDGAVRCAFTRD
jgi:hypothetical protein